MNHDVKKLGIYIHIPFCVRKCNYCDFLSFPAEETVKYAYVSILCSQIGSGVPDGAPVEVSAPFVSPLFAQVDAFEAMAPGEERCALAIDDLSFDAA